MRRYKWLIPAVILLASLPGTPQIVNSPAAPPPEPAVLPGPAIRAVTHMVLLDVVASDNRGKFVGDLGREDFTVQEDGVPQKIAFFSKSDAKEAPSDTTAIALARGPGMFTNRPESADAGGLVVILLDSLNSAMLDQHIAKQQALKFLKKQLPADRKVAVFALTDRLLMLQNFTDDPRILQKAVDAFIPAKSHVASRGEPVMLPKEIAALIPLAMLENLKRFNQESAVSSSDERAKLTLAALRALGRFLMGRPGRKSLLWVSAGFPDSLALYSSAAVNHNEEMRQTAVLLSEAQVAMYPVDVRGLVVDPYVGSPGEIVPTVESPELPAFGDEEMSHAAVQIDTSHVAMENLASQTGGHAFYNGNDLALAMTKAVSESSSYYTIGYYPENKKWDGKFRNVRVKLQRRGIVLKTRLGYYAVDPVQTASAKGDGPPDLLAAVADALPATGILFTARVGEALPSSYKLDLWLDPSNLSFETDKNGLSALTLEVMVMIVGEKQDPARQIRQTVTTRLRPDELQKARENGFPIHLALHAASKPTVLNLAVRDVRSGLVGSLRIPIATTAENRVNERR